MNIIPVAKSVVVKPKKMIKEGSLEMEVKSSFSFGTLVEKGEGVDISIEKGDVVMYVGGRDLPNGCWIVQEKEIYGKIKEEQ